ncbi:HAMP domain-containing sensor histidine kinase, partial [Oleiphilus sp. HI0079]
VDLERQKLRAEDATKAKSEFLANMSHEIRTPLNGINGMAQILQRSGLNSDQRSQIETILTSTGSLTQIINDILDFSKIEAGKIEIERMDFSLLALIESAVDQVTMLANKSENQLVIQYSSRLPEYVNSDPSRIRQVMLNLLSNANKFTNGGVVEVRAEVMERMGDAYFKISIKDSGIGISEDKLAYIFEAFSQEDTSTTRKFGGTGLGLTICKRLAQLMGGDIAVTSTQGKGSRFSFFLPLIEADVPESEVRSGPLRHIKPMIFDNNEVRRRAMRNHLESWGLESVVFEDVSDFMLALQQLVG